MSLEIQLYFKPEDLQNLLSSSPSKIFLTVKSVPPELNSPEVLIAYAKGYNEGGLQVGSIAIGCPSPCHPNDISAECGDKTEQLLNNYKNSNLF